MRFLTSALLVAHIFAGTVAVIVGLVALIMPKPIKPHGKLWHQRSGRYFLYSMIVVLGTATILTIISFNPYFAGLTAAATVAVFSGYRVLRRKRPDLDAAQRAQLLDWVVTIVILGVGVFLIMLAASGGITQNLPVVYSLGVGSALYATYDLYRFARPLGFPFSPNLWLYEHLVKMIGGYFGAVAAFSGSVLVVLPPPWRQLWATTLGQILAVIFVLYYRRRLNRNSTRTVTAADTLNLARD